MKVQTDTSTYSGITTKYFPRHWRGYQKFSFQILNPGPDIFFITCRINDRQHNRRIQEYNDRFNQRFMLDVGLNDITIDLDKVFQAPQTRDMDQNDICEIMFFVTRQKTRRTFFLDNLMLEK